MGRPSVLTAAIVSTLANGPQPGSVILDRVVAAGLTPNRTAGRNAIQYALNQGYIERERPGRGQQSAVYRLPAVVQLPR